MPQEVWVLGATGRSGRAIAARVAAAGLTTVLVGRDPARLDAVARGLQGARTLAAGSVGAMVDEVRRHHPAVVVNTVGPFATTGVPIAAASLQGGSYLDLGNDVTAVSALLDLHDVALAAGRTLVTGAGFGVLATESLVATVCHGRPAPDQVRVDAIPSVALEEGVLGEALAATIVDGLPDGGRRYEQGRLVRTRIGADAQRLTLPDGTSVTTAGAPTGELLAAQRASGAARVIAASSEVPTARALRVLLPPAAVLLRVRPLRDLARRRLAAVRITARPRPREHSWAHALVRWPDGTSREGWLRTGDASAFTAAVAAEVVTRLAGGSAPAGAHTPAAAFGPDLAVDAGGTLILGDEN